MLKQNKKGYLQSKRLQEVVVNDLKVFYVVKLYVVK